MSSENHEVSSLDKLRHILFESEQSVPEIQHLLQQLTADFEQYKQKQIDVLQSQLKDLIVATFHQAPISWKLQFIPGQEASISLYWIRATAEHYNISLSPWSIQLGYSGHISWDQTITLSFLQEFLHSLQLILARFIPSLQGKVGLVSKVQLIEADHTVFFLWNFE